MNKFLLVLLLTCVSTIFVSAQSENEEPSKWDKIKEHLTIEGYLQAQWNYRTSRDVVSKLDSLGNSTSVKIQIDSVAVNTMSGGYFERYVSNKFTLRRGVIGIGLNYEFLETKVSFDINERGFHARDLYIKLTDPWLNVFSAQGGIFRIPFGHELKESSADRPFAERSRVVQHLFPSTRDVGAAFSIAAPDSSKLNGLVLDVAVINGAIGNEETDKYKDFVGRIRYDRKLNDDKIEIGVGVSYYWGGHAHFSNMNTVTDQFFIFQGIEKTPGDTAYFAVDSVFTSKAGRPGVRVPRKYYGGDIKLGVEWTAGKTLLSAEMIGGKQTGTMSRTLDPLRFYTATSYTPKGTTTGVSWVNYSPPTPANPVSVSTQRGAKHNFIRRFRGGSVSILHEFMNTGLELGFRYDWYDPNIDIEGRDIRIIPSLSQGLRLSVADVKYQTFSIALNYEINEYIKILANYDIVRNEETSIEPRAILNDTDDTLTPSWGFIEDQPDDVLTIRLQVRF